MSEPKLTPAQTAVSNLAQGLKEVMPLLHRVSRRECPGYRDHGHLGTSQRPHEFLGDIMGGLAREVCVGCEIEALLIAAQTTASLLDHSHEQSQ